MTTDSSPPEPTVPEVPILQQGWRLSVVWIIPIVAVLLGLWLSWRHFSSLGPLIEIRFETAEGVEEGKTTVDCRSVKIGIVETVRLTEDLKGVVVMLRIDRDATRLLREDTRFWVVRPRFGGSGISGLGTVVSGTYIEVDPGTSDRMARRFTGLEHPPATPQGIPGLRVILAANEAGSLGPGSPVVYRGLTVGRIESRDFDASTGQITFGVFVEDEYAALVTDRAKFWNVSGIDFEVDADGVRLRTGTLESLILGGVSFESAESGVPSAPARDGTVFTLHNRYSDTQAILPELKLTYLLLFEDSVRGLGPEAPVEFRGIRVGTVLGISFDYLPDSVDRRVPVLIAVDPGLVANVGSDDIAAGERMVEESVDRGLRASLKTGNLLTGQLFVDLDFHPDSEPARVADISGFRVLPTVPSGFGRIQESLVAVLEKIRTLPLEETVDNASGALAEIRTTAAELNAAVASFQSLLASRETQELPGDLKESLLALRKTLEGFDQNSVVYRDLTEMIADLGGALRSIDSLATSIERNPNSLLFGRPAGRVTPPRGKRSGP